MINQLHKILTYVPNMIHICPNKRERERVGLEERKENTASGGGGEWQNLEIQ